MIKILKILLLLSFTLVSAADFNDINTATAVDSKKIEKRRKSGKFSADLRLFYMIRTFDHIRNDAKAFNAGEILKYESGEYHRLKFGLAYYGSHKIDGFYSRKQGIGTSHFCSETVKISSFWVKPIFTTALVQPH